MTILDSQQAAGQDVGPIVLSARDITVEYGGERPTRAVRRVSLDLHRGEVLGIAGESGCGKSTLAFAITRLLRPPARLVHGSVHFHSSEGGEPVDVLALDKVSLRKFRWSKIAFVFQSAMNSLNPVISIRRQFSDMFEAHQPGMSRDERDRRSGDLLEMVGIDRNRLKSYPHELSGGMRQRVGIAMALALQPEIVVMDEPTTALDVVVQREILEQINVLRREFGFAVIFITHDLPMLIEMSDRLAIMYAGEIVEQGPASRVGRSPSHPYTQGLRDSCPDLLGERRELHGIPGSPPDLRFAIKGCAFQPRCSYAIKACRTTRPSLAEPFANVKPMADPSGASAVACLLHNPSVNPAGPPSELVGETQAESIVTTVDSETGLHVERGDNA